MKIFIYCFKTLKSQVNNVFVIKYLFKFLNSIKFFNSGGSNIHIKRTPLNIVYAREKKNSWFFPYRLVLIYVMLKIEYVDFIAQEIVSNAWELWVAAIS